MTSKQELIQNPSANRFQELSLQFDQAVGVDTKRGAAEALVRFGTEETFDALNTMRVLGKAATLTTSTNAINKACGEQMVRGVDSYFTNLGISYKLLLPFGEKIQMRLNEVLGLSLWINKSSSQIMGSKGVKEFLQSVQVVLGDLSRIENAHATAVVLTIPERDQVRRRGKTYEQLKSLRMDIIAEATRGGFAEDASDKMQTPERIFAMVAQLSKIKIRSIPDVMNASFNGISFADVMTEPDNDRFCKKALTYIHAVPKGDIFWQRLLEGTLFMHASKIYDVEPNAFLTNPTMFKNINFFHEWLAGKLLLPGFDPAFVDEEFDTYFGSIIANTDEILFHKMMLMLYSTISLSPLQRQLFEPDMSLDAILQQSPIPGYIWSQLENDNLYKRTVLIDGAVHSFFAPNWAIVKANVLSRFPNNQRIDTLVDVFGQEIFDTDIQEVFAQVLVGVVRRNAGEEFLDQLNTKQHEMQERIDRLSNVLEKNPLPKWDGEGSFVFNLADSPYYALGFASVSFIVSDTAYPVYVSIEGTDKAFFISGRLNEGGRIAELSTGADIGYPGLQLFVNELILGHFRTLLELRGKNVRRQKVPGKQTLREKRRGANPIDINEAMMEILAELEGEEHDK